MRKAAVVLSSGSARGLAHIGALEELEARGYEITSIAGCSMGSLIGGMYASGKLEEFKEWMKSITFKKMFSLADFTLSPNHMVKGKRIIQALEQIAPDVNIEDLKIPYCAVASDITTGEEVIFNTGSLYRAIRSSISLPIFFRPVTEGKSVLIDGGVLNPLPLNRVKRTEGDILVSVNVSAPYDEALKKTSLEQNNFISLVDKMTDLMIQRNCALMEKFYDPDVRMSLGMGSYSSFDFDKSDIIIQRGRDLMSEALDNFEMEEKERY